MIKFLDLHKINERFRDEFNERIKNILDCGLSLPVTEKIHREIISLPISPVMTDEETEKVVGVINAYI